MTPYLNRLSSLILACALAASASAMQQSIPALGAPSGTVVNVSSAAGLLSAIQNLHSNTTIMIAAGHYDVSQANLGVAFMDIGGGSAISNVAIRGATGNAGDVVLDGGGMTNNGSSAAFIFEVDNASNVLFGDFSMGDVYFSALQLQSASGCQSITVHNCILFDTGEQLIKGNPTNDSGGNSIDGVNNSLVEYCQFKYTTAAPPCASFGNQTYTNAIDIHHGANWHVQCSTFVNIQGAAGNGAAGPTILFWNKSSNPLVERNWFYNCDRGIFYGLGQVAGSHDCTGGIIRNNMIMLNDSGYSDAEIAMWDCPNTQVYSNTCVNSAYQNSIEYRFSTCTGVVIENNLCDNAVNARDGATGTVTHNLSGIQTNWFVNFAQGDLHLTSSASGAFAGGVFPLAACPDDWDGNNRPQSSAPDLGAHQYHAAAGTTTTGTTGTTGSSSTTGSSATGSSTGTTATSGSTGSSGSGGTAVGAGGGSSGGCGLGGGSLGILAIAIALVARRNAARAKT